MPVPLTIVGTLGAKPELKQVGSNFVVNFSVAVTERVFNRESNQFEDGGTSWYRCSIWKSPAENFAASLDRGDRVIVTGNLKERVFERNGEKRSAWEVEVEEVGPSLRYARAEVTKVGAGNRNQSARQQQYGQQRSAAPAQQSQRQQQDAWAATSGYDSDEPF